MGLLNLFSASKIHNIDEVYFDETNSDEFLINYYIPRIPVLIKGGAKQWPLIEKWNNEYVAKAFGNYECTIVSDSRPAYSKEKDTLKNYFSRHQGKSTLTLERFNNSKAAFFLKDIKIPNAFFKEKDIARYFFFHSVKNAGTLPHVHRDAFNTLQTGKKHWVFYDANAQSAPKGFKELKQCHLNYPPGTHARTWFENELPKLPKRIEKVYQCFQEPGDIVYIPIEYSHAVLNHSEVMGVVVETNRNVQ